MTEHNPYDVNYPGKFEITYAGFAGEHHCYRIKLAEQKGLDGCMFQMEVSQWLFEVPQGKWFMGNNFPYVDYPDVKFYNPGSKDVFVLFGSLADAAMFENEFSVSGLTPTMLV